MLRILSPRAQVLEIVELAGGVAAADHGADRGADDDIGHDAVSGQRAHDADMGKAARGAAAERQADGRAGGLRLDRTVGIGGAIAVASTREKTLKHQTRSPVVPTPSSNRTCPQNKNFDPIW